MSNSILRGALLAACLAAAAPPTLLAQQGGIIAGRVLDAASGAPIPSAQVQIVNTNRGVVTGDDGRFRIVNLQPGTYRVRVLRIGYQAGAQTVTVGTGAAGEIVFRLNQTAVNLDQVVTTATGETERKREQGSAVSTFVPRQAEVVATANPSQLLAGRVPGVDVQQPGGTVGTGSRIRIRGSNSLALSNEPLIVVDGIRYNNATGVNNFTGANTIGVGGQVPSRFNDINPEDIAKIEVLKGPAAAALYGTAAASGVIQITTKHGRQQRPVWNAYVQGGLINDVTKYPANYAQPGTLGSTGTGKATPKCRIADQAAGLCTANGALQSFNPLVAYSPFIQGRRGGYGGSVTGGSDLATYYLSGTFDKQQGVVESSLDQRAAGRVNLTAQLRDNWNVQVGTSYLADHLLLPQNDNNILGIVSSGLLGSASDNSSSHGYLSGQVPQAIYAIQTRQDIQRFENSVNTSYQPLSWLQATGVFGLDYMSRYDNQIIPPNKVLFGSYPEGQRTSNPYQVFDYTANMSLVATWSPFESLKSTTTAGYQFTKEMVKGTRAFGAKLLGGTGSLQGASARFAVGEANPDNKTLGILGIEQLAWRDRLFLNASLRRDRNSAFGQNFRGITYPSVSASWVVSEEPFFPRLAALNQLRLRAAVGRAGRQPSYRDASTYFNTQTVTVNGTDVPGIIVGGTGNANLRPERSTETELGFDAGLLDNKLGLEVTYYNKKTDDLLVAVPLSPSLGLTTTQYKNLGTLRNAGWEYSVNGKVLDTRPVKLDFTVSGSTNSNKLLTLGKLPNGDPVPPIVVNTQQQHRIGYPVGGYWLRSISYKDVNGDGIIARSEVTLSDTTVYMGNPFPKREISFAPAVTLFERLRIAALFDHKGGFKLFNNTARFRCSFGNCRAAYDKTAPLAEQAAAVAIPMGSDAGYIENGSYTKLRELSFTVTASDRVAHLFRVGGLDLTIAGQNLKTWTKYKGFDPEINSTPGLLFSTSDFLTLPPTRNWTARINVTF